ncbi:MAG: hypothetical protein M3361_17740 [Candidatus Tectomicrobia bacterium]|nr:hypothetical protein [Candidatus Tectomicrobia bacterium]
MLGLQKLSRPWGPPVRRHLPDYAEQLKRKQCQLQHGQMAILLAALRIDRDDPARCGSVETRIEHEQLLRLLDVHGVIMDLQHCTCDNRQEGRSHGPPNCELSR